LWNIGRFLLTKVGTEPVLPLHAIATASLTIADRWILDRLDAAISECNAALGPVRPGASGRWTEAERTAGMRLDAYADTARRFVWNELADWYLETVKPRLATDGDDADVARAVLVHCFDHALRLLQPIIPFITETLWAKLPEQSDARPRGEDFLCTSAWPDARGDSPSGGAAFDLVINATVAIRQLRNEYKVKPARFIAVSLHPSATDTQTAHHLADTIGALTRSTVRVTQSAAAVTAEKSVTPGSSAHAVLAGGSEIDIALSELRTEESAEDIAKECARLKVELDSAHKILAGIQSKLSNEAFTSRAKPEVVDGARAQERDVAQKVDSLTRKVEALCGTS
jgi:valyl-tRNA synthetase